MLKIIGNVLKNRHGFTLVELMVVVVIIGILAAVAIPLYNNQTETARLNVHMSNIKIIESAVQQYKAVENVSTPTDLAVNSVSDFVNTHPLADYIQDWPDGPGEYTLAADGALTANPTKAATNDAINNGDAVTWP